MENEHIAVSYWNRTRQLQQSTKVDMQRHLESDLVEEELSELNGVQEREIKFTNSKPLIEVRINGQ